MADKPVRSLAVLSAEREKARATATPVSPLDELPSGDGFPTSDEEEGEGDERVVETQGSRERLVMCPPRYLSTHIKNNVWMSGQPVDVDRAIRQYRRVRNVLVALGRDVLEIPPKEGLQDQTYVANIGIAIAPVVILANYKAPGRAGEVPVAKRFFEAMGYETIRPPFHFEGEADLKKLRDGVYFGGYGQFTDDKAFDWIEQQTGVDIIRLHEVSEELYHLDCSLFVIDEETVLLTGEGIDQASRDRVAEYCEVIETPDDIASTGITNGVKIPEERIYLSGTFNPEQEDYQKAMEWLLETFDRFGYTVVLLDVDEADKSGADLSCCVMHLDFEPAL